MTVGERIEELFDDIVGKAIRSHYNGMQRVKSAKLEAIGKAPRIELWLRVTYESGKVDYFAEDAEVVCGL